MTKFKVGDKVVFTYDSFSQYFGQVYTVVSVNKGYAWLNLFGPQSKDAVEDTWIRLVTPLEELL